MVLGLDDPYPLGEMESEPQSSYPGKILDLAVEREIIDQDEYDAMWSDNTVRWLCGDDSAAQDALLRRIRGESVGRPAHG